MQHLTAHILYHSFKKEHFKESQAAVANHDIRCVHKTKSADGSVYDFHLSHFASPSKLNPILEE